MSRGRYKNTLSLVRRKTVRGRASEAECLFGCLFVCLQAYGWVCVCMLMCVFVGAHVCVCGCSCVCVGVCVCVRLRIFVSEKETENEGLV